MLEAINQFDSELFLYFNSRHSGFSDFFWQAVTETSTWIPLHILLIGLFVKTFRKSSIWVICGALLVVLVCDQVTSTFMKPFFGRLRPCHDPIIGHLVHVVKSCGGRYGFVSSHAANAFGVAVYCWLMLRRYFRFSWLLFGWAGLVAFSRIMVGVHYPADIIVGSIVGVVAGWIVFKITDELYFRYNLDPLIKS